MSILIETVYRGYFRASPSLMPRHREAARLIPKQLSKNPANLKSVLITVAAHMRSGRCSPKERSA